MPITTKPMFADLPSVTLVDLATVKGGCKSKKCQPCPPPPAPAPAPQPMAPAPAPRDEISTNVSITGY
jgi:hypothetical protein